MSASAGTWGLRGVALLLAFLVWALITLEQREPESIKVLNTTIRYDIPSGFILLEPSESARITVRGKASSLRNLNPFQVDVFVGLETTEKGPTSVPLTRDNVSLPEDVQIVTIEPGRLNLMLDREVTRMLPVKARTVGEPAAGAISQGASVNPPRVPVRGPESRIEQIVALDTTPVNLDGHAIDFEERAGVVSDDPTLQILQPVVTVRVPLLIPSANDGGSR